MVGVLRFAPEAGFWSALTWIGDAAWWCLVFLGLEYTQRIFVRLNRGDDARRARGVRFAYLLLIVLPVASSSVAPGLLDALISIATKITAFVLLVWILWTLRRALLRPDN